jgi:hypothetical protein
MEPPSRFPSQGTNRRKCSVYVAVLEFSESPVNGPPTILNRAPVEKGGHLERLFKYLVKSILPNFPVVLRR